MVAGLWRSGPTMEHQVRSFSFTKEFDDGLGQLCFTLDANGRAINVTRVQGTKRDLSRKSAKRQ